MRVTMPVDEERGQRGGEGGLQEFSNLENNGTLHARGRSVFAATNSELTVPPACGGKTTGAVDCRILSNWKEGTTIICGADTGLADHPLKIPGELEDHHHQVTQVQLQPQSLRRSRLTDANI